MGRGLREACLFVGVLVLVGSVGFAPAGAATLGPDGTPDVSQSATAADSVSSTDVDRTSVSDSNVELTQRLRLVPDEPGVYDVTHRYRLPDQLRGLEVTLPPESTVVAASGFDRQEGRTYEWDGSTERPTIDYRMAANRTVEQTGPIGGPGRLTFVDVGEWALITRPGSSHSWSWTGGGDVGLDRSAVTDEGAIGSTIGFLGPHEEYTHTAHGQTFRLIVPEAADLEESPEELFAAFSDASDRLRVGDRDETVFVVAAPTPDGLQWGVRGLHTGGADVWVRDFERLDEANNVWLHEYVHTRQGYVAADDARWFTEASAVYYAALLSLEAERIDYETFRSRIAHGEGEYDGSVMTRPDTWRQNANYYVGALVAGELDRRVRLASDGDASLQDVYRRMNARDGEVDAADVRASLRAAGGDDVARLGERYTTTTDRPAMWNATQHREAFGEGSIPTQVTYAIASGPDSARVSGAYRNRSVDVDGLTLVPGERLSVDVVATNVGGGGDYEATLHVDDESVSTQSGRLAPEESDTLTFAHTFERTGVRTVSVGDVTLRVEVREPATARASNLTANRTDLPAGEWVRLSAVVRNDADYPGETNLTFTRAGDPIETRTVRLDANESSTIETAIRLDEPGTYAFGLGNETAETIDVTVTENAGGDGDQTDTETPGFGPGVTVAAVVAVALATAVRLRRDD
ncbi:hypothetical protein [Halobellus salinisoli]|uniref:hypothetical protein n=1 Tax=Halobellus salinisoli TaxID=3108500 RepID=UPI00300BF333